MVVRHMRLKLKKFSTKSYSLEAEACNPVLTLTSFMLPFLSFGELIPCIFLFLPKVHPDWCFTSHNYYIGRT